MDRSGSIEVGLLIESLIRMDADSRMDKFYLLIRRYVNATFRLQAKHAWSAESVEGVNKILTDGPLSYTNRSVPSSLSTHLGDIYLDELDKVLALPEVNSQPACPLTAVLQPLTTLIARTPTATVHTRIISSLHTPLLNALAAASDTERPGEHEQPDAVYAHIVMGCCLGNQGSEPAVSPKDLRKGVLASLFSTAADPDANETDRRKIYKVWREEGGDDDDDE